MKGLLIRSASALVFATLMIGGIWYSSYTYLLVVLVISIGALREFYNISTPRRSANETLWNKYKKLAIALGVMAILFSFFSNGGLPRFGSGMVDTISTFFSNRKFSLLDVGLFLPMMLFVFFIVELYSKSENPFDNIGWNVVALVYIVMPMLLMNKLYFDNGPIFLLATIFIIWIYDSACYVFGSLLGKNPLMPRVSPKKTKEGLIGGLIATLVIIYFVYNRIPWLADLKLSNALWVVLALVTCVAATFGDLVESLLKRSVDVKDSGSIMPGHGGFLDRFDSVFIAMPFIAFTVWGIGQWQALALIIQFLKL
jgi:phosphatidate cytidylyltransferase